jgi:hypothetical protein
MHLEAWNTVFAGATFVVIGATAIAALVQLRHLRASNQLNTLLTLMQMWQTPEMQRNVGYVRGALQQDMKDPNFMRAFDEGSVSRSEHKEMLVADFFEQVGTFLKYGLMDERPWIDAAGPQIIITWDRMEPIVKAFRKIWGPVSFENFEYAAVRAKLWFEKYPDGFYPRSTPRMDDVKARQSRAQA